MIDRITEQPFCQTRVMGSTGYENEIFNEDCLATMDRMDKVN